ncbi:MAG: DUF839 domain-containing protein [Proteobacteria bacterium]|nr:DUF839 domain-containing protein [Pseudomonadota bacterium]
MFKPTSMALAIAAALASSQAFAVNTEFDNFTPLTASAGPLPVAGESTPITLSSAQFAQKTVAERNVRLGLGQFDSGAWDMITSNESGPDAGRYLFAPFESGQAGIMRVDLQTNTTSTIWRSPAVGGHVAFDASYWTPWGTYVTAEESWSGNADTGVSGNTSGYGRLFEVTNPLKPTGTVDIVHRNAVARVSHEGLQFDSLGRMYYIDETNGGALYRFESAAGVGDDYFAGGVNSVLRVGDGSLANATGAGQFIAFTDNTGAALAGAATLVDINGVESVDGRASANVAAFKGTSYQRPEDLQIGHAANGDELLYMTTTTTNEIYAYNITTNSMSLFADVNTIDLGTGQAVGAGLRSPDNLAVDAEGNIYIIEDRNGGVDDDIWFAKDINHDGDLLDAGEGLARWASNGVQGSEFTGLYFDPLNPNRAWVNIQHPGSGNDRLMELTAAPVPVPAAVWMFGSALCGMVGLKRRKVA